MNIYFTCESNSLFYNNKTFLWFPCFYLNSQYLRCILVFKLSTFINSMFICTCRSWSSGHQPSLRPEMGGAEIEWEIFDFEQSRYLDPLVESWTPPHPPLPFSSLLFPNSSKWIQLSCHEKECYLHRVRLPGLNFLGFWIIDKQHART